MSDLLLFAVFPYLAVAAAAGAGIYRAARLRDTLTARSSQLLESRLQKVGAVPWHWAILLILAAHFAAILFPHSVGVIVANPARVYTLEQIFAALGLLAVWGMALLVVRRLSLTHSTAAMDWVLLVALLVQAATGVYIALAMRWGSGWFVYTASPWLASLATLHPQIDRVVVLPAIVKLHFVNAFVIVALLPLSRLIHAVTVPVSYLWRAPQIVSVRHAP